MPKSEKSAPQLPLPGKARTRNINLSAMRRSAVESCGGFLLDTLPSSPSRHQHSFLSTLASLLQSRLQQTPEMLPQRQFLHPRDSIRLNRSKTLAPVSKRSGGSFERRLAPEIPHLVVLCQNRRNLIVERLARPVVRPLALSVCAREDDQPPRRNSFEAKLGA